MEKGKRKEEEGVGNMAQFFKGLPHQHTDPNRIPTVHQQKASVLVHAYNSSTG